MAHQAAMVGILDTENAPTHLVAFRRRSEANAEMLTEMIGDKKPNMEAGVLSFSPGRGKKSSARYHERLAVAEMDMTDAEAHEMRARDGVEAVVRNEIRHIPRPVQSTPRAAEAAPEQALLPPELADYLRGMRDMANLLLDGSQAQFQPVTRRTSVAMDQDMTWGLRAIGMTSGTSLTGRGVKMGVLDTGLDLNHPDFAGFNEATHGKAFVGVASVQDGHGHGTHCCGTAVGTMNPSRGPRYSVAPGAELMVGKVLADDGRGFDHQIVNGVTWAADNGAKIISMSLGSDRAVNGDFSRFYETVFRQMTAEGILCIVAAGNESRRPFDMAAVGNPAACPSAMAVAALDRDMRVANFSCAQLDNIGLLDVAGPGVDVHSAWTGGGYRSIPGTSMATPHVAGIAAMHLENDPSLTPDELRDLIRAQVRPLSPVRDFGAGLAQVPVTYGTPVA